MTMGWGPVAMAGTMMRTPLEVAGLMVDAAAEGAKLYWSWWGPLGQPAVMVVDAVADLQRQCLGWMVDAFDQALPSQ